MTRAEYASIQRLATEHILKGGGVVPNGEVTEFDPITAVAIASFDATAADQSFDRSLAGLDRARQEEIYSAVWDLVGVYQDAAYAFGAAVGLQLNGWSAPGNGDEESADEPRR